MFISSAQSRAKETHTEEKTYRREDYELMKELHTRRATDTQMHTYTHSASASDWNIFASLHIPQVHSLPISPVSVEALLIHFFSPHFCVRVGCAEEQYTHCHAT